MIRLRYGIALRADIKSIVDGEAARCAASPSISVLTYLRIAIAISNLTKSLSLRKLFWVG